MSTLFKSFLLIFGFTLLCLPINAQSPHNWETIKDAQFKEVFVQKYYMLKSILDPDEHIKSLVGQEFQISGYYIPIATKDNSIILSKNPFASCFFCGSAGQETVMDIRLKDTAKTKFVADQRITVKGKLAINDTDWENLSFILEDAEILEEK